MSKRLTLCCEVNTFTGFGQHALEIIRSLQERGQHVSVRPIKVNEDFGAKVPGPVKALFVNKVQPEPWELVLSHPTFYPTPGKRTAYFTMWESTTLPAKTVALLNHAELVMVPTAWGASCFAASGVKSPMAIVPLGVDPKVFKPKPPVPGPVIFGTAGRLANGHYRKGVADVIQTFRRAFPHKTDVKLRVKLFPDCPLPEVADTRIEIVRACYTPEQLAEWYAGLTCFVSGARGEGWGLMQHQAMACGRPVMASLFGGLTAFMHSGNSFPVPFTLVPVREWHPDSGYWAEPDWAAMAETMREIYRQPQRARQVGALAARSVAHLTWDNHHTELAKALTSAGALPGRPDVVSGCDLLPADLTVAITSFQRPKHLERALASAVQVARNIVVATMQPDVAVDAVLAKWRNKLGARLVVSRLALDLGCNELWLQAAYRCPTERVILLHDDDFLDPKLRECYTREIAPFLDGGGGWATWLGHVVWDDGRRGPAEWFNGPTRMLPAQVMEDWVGQKGRLSLSPVVSVLRRSVLIAALKEAQQSLTAPECLLRPGMLLGTEILAYLRHCSSFDTWLFVGEVLSYYGAHEGSGTAQAEMANDLSPLLTGYDVARSHYYRAKHAPPAPAPRLLLVYSDYTPNDADEKRRVEAARRTWDFHFNQGSFLEFPIRDTDLARSSAALQDPRPVPYFKDLIAHALRYARPEDVIVYVNRDLCLTTLAPERVMEGLKRGGGVTVGTRRNWPHPLTPDLRRSVLNCKPDGGYDLFAFTPDWWRAHERQMPDMLIGREAWDTCLRVLAEESGLGDGVYVDDTSYHENHGSYWIGQRLTNSGQHYNRKLALEFFKARPRDPRSPWIIKQLTP